MLWKCCTQYASKFGKLSSGHRTGKGQFSFQFQRRAMPKNVQTIFHNCIHLKRWQNNAQSSPSQASIVCELWTSDVPAEFRKGREEPENKLPTSVGSSKKQKSSRKTSTSALLTMPKPLCESENRSVISDSLRSHRLYSPWNSPGQNTGVGSCSLLQGIYPTQELNPGLPHCRGILYQLSHQRSA